MSFDSEECARDQAFSRLIDYGVDGLPCYDFNEELNWWFKWARKRENQVAGWLIEALSAIVNEDFNSVDEIKSFSNQMLKRYAEKKQKNVTPIGINNFKGQNVG